MAQNGGNWPPSRLVKAAGENRNGHRDSTMVLVAYRHGLRAAEVVALRWDFGRGELHVSRVKKGTPSVHPISGRELRMLRRLPQDSARLGAAAGFEYPTHPHQLRHGCGFKLATDGHDTRSLQAYLGHKNVAHTVRYTELAPTRFSISGKTDCRALKHWQPCRRQS